MTEGTVKNKCCKHGPSIIERWKDKAGKGNTKQKSQEQKGGDSSDGIKHKNRKSYTNFKGDKEWKFEKKKVGCYDC